MKETTPELNLNDVQLFDPTVKKKKKKAPKKTQKTDPTAQKEETAVFTDPYTYEHMLNRINSILQNNNPFANTSKKIHLKPVSLEMQTKGKYKWINFLEFANQLRRSPEHLASFVSAELGIETLIAGDFLKIERKKLGVEELQSILKRYILEYVKCPLCHSAQTLMEKDQNIRAYVMKCEACMSQRTVQPVKKIKKT